MSEEKFWVLTISADHSARAQREGVIQACHGKVAPLRRMQAGDGVVIYSPRTTFPAGAPLQSFTAIGRVRPGAPYLYEMGGGFTPYRRDVNWEACAPAPIRPMLDDLDLTRGQRSWGTVFRYGLTQLTKADFMLIHRAMQPGFIAEGMLL